MGFPEWTLWGMGLSAFGALLCIGFAYLALSPNFAQRNRALAARLIPRLRMLTGMAFALLLVSLGFFLAGVPLDGEQDEGLADLLVPTAVALPNDLDLTSNESMTDTMSLEVAELDGDEEILATVAPQPTSSTPESGAFIRPPAADEESTVAGTEPVTSTQSSDPTPLPPGVPSSTPSPTPTPSNTPTATPTPTITPTPTFTPTPIMGETADITLGGGTVWLRQSPTDNAAQVVLIDDGTAVLPTGRRANVAGVLWTEVQTLAGRTGWIRTLYLRGDAFPSPTPTFTPTP